MRPYIWFMLGFLTASLLTSGVTAFAQGRGGNVLVMFGANSNGIKPVAVSSTGVLQLAVQ